MTSINNNTEWKKKRESMEATFEAIGEFPRITRCNKDDNGKFGAVVLEGGLNIMYNLRDRDVVIWGVGKRHSNGHIAYEDLVRKIEVFKKEMEDCTL